MGKKVICKCSKCGRRFEMGYNGISDDNGDPVCDSCADVQRDQHGYAWDAKDRKNGSDLEDPKTGKIKHYQLIGGRAVKVK